jgi:hypothetical protein
MQESKRPLLQILCVAVLLLPCSSLRAGEGFGMMKKTANLTRVHPPQVFIPGTKIAIRATAAGGRHAAIAQRIQAELESELLGHNPRLKVDAARPDATIDLSVLQSDYSESWEDRQMVRSVKTGAVDKKNRPIYRDEQVTVRFKVVKYSFSTAYKVHDVRADRSLAGDTISWPYAKDFQDGNGAPDTGSLETSAVHAVVGELTTKLAPTKETIGVLLPKGSLENAAAFADAGLWSKYLDALDKLGALKTPTDEAYRQYALGVAYEALGYGADDSDTTLKYLEQASVHYNNAVDANPREGYFTKPYQSLLFSRSAEAPIGRVQSALVQYQKLKEFAESIASRPAGGGGVSGSKGDLTAAADDAITNQSVIDMLRAGLPEDVILTSIDSAPHTAFDVTPRGLIQLSDAKASTKMIQHIQGVAGGKKSTKSPSATKKSPAKKS